MSNVPATIKLERPPKRQPRSVLFVPRTNRGELLARLRLGEAKLAEILDSTVKMVERGGLSLSATLVQKNPWGHVGCGRPGCNLCAVTESNSYCRTRSVVYENRCLDCSDQGLDIIYVGETGLSGAERQKQHQDDARLKPDKSHIRKHCDEYHPDMDHRDVRFQFKIIKRIPSPFQRQIAEAINIRLRTRNGKEILLNNKQEFSRCVLPELEVCMQDRIVSQEISKEVKNNALTTRMEEDPEDDEAFGRKRDRQEDQRPQPKKRRKVDRKTADNKTKVESKETEKDGEEEKEKTEDEKQSIASEIGIDSTKEVDKYGKVNGGPILTGQNNYKPPSNLNFCY